mgnify:FL=1
MRQVDDFKYLGIKVVLIIGIAGACRCDEMVKMTVDDIEDLGSLLHVKLPNTKTNKSRSFTVVGEMYVTICRKYFSLRPKELSEKRLFLKYQSGKCHRAVMGIHKIGSVPCEVASFLKLLNCKQYTGHALRRTSATLLVDAGGDVTTLKRHGGWKSSSVAEGYIDESMHSKEVIANKILSPVAGCSKAFDVLEPENSAYSSTAIVDEIDTAMGSIVHQPKLPVPPPPNSNQQDFAVINADAMNTFIWLINK